VSNVWDNMSSSSPFEMMMFTGKTWRVAIGDNSNSTGNRVRFDGNQLLVLDKTAKLLIMVIYRTLLNNVSPAASSQLVKPGQSVG
jgi:hypothetical protein